jgi:hypothetical protein
VRKVVEVKLKAKACYVNENDVSLEFGSTQAEMWFSGNGKIQKLLKLKNNDKVEITIKKA